MSTHLNAQLKKEKRIQHCLVYVFTFYLQGEFLGRYENFSDGSQEINS